MHMHRRSLCAVLSLVMLLVGCGGGGTGPDDRTPAGRITATINGTTFATTAARAIPVSSAPGSIAFSAIQAGAGGSGTSLAFNLGYINGVGTYPLGTNVSTTAGGDVIYIDGGVTYGTPLSGTAGSITITTLTTSRVVGTFAFTATRRGTGADAVVTGGTFDVPLSTGYVAPTAALAGSTITARIGGDPRVMATVTGLGGSSSRTLTGRDLTWLITVSAGPFSAPSSGPFTDAAIMPVRRVVVQRMGTPQSWGGSDGDSGSLTITAISGFRIAGTFSGTLAPNNANTTGNLTIADGTFDVRTP